MPPAAHNTQEGFSLIEVVVAMAIITGATLVLALSLQQSTETTGFNRTREDASRMEKIVRFHLRKAEFTVLYSQLVKKDPSFYVYTYRSDPERLRPDGSYSPSTSNHLTTSAAVRQSDDPLFAEDLATMEKVFRLRIIPFEVQTGKPLNLPSDLGQFEDSALHLSIAVYKSREPGTEPKDIWPKSDKILSFPIVVRRWK